uniref:Uncharacterized protein n=1 Tax=Trichogramma kaykai TaxID=54128 RepID=A0ABD2XBY5_9HYME
MRGRQNYVHIRPFLAMCAKSVCAPYALLLLFLVCRATRDPPEEYIYNTICGTRDDKTPALDCLVRYTNERTILAARDDNKKINYSAFIGCMCSSAGRPTCHRAVCCAVCASAAESNRVRSPRASLQFFIAHDRFFSTKCRKIIPARSKPSSRVLVSRERRYRGSQAPTMEPRLAREASKNRVRAEANKESWIPRAPLSSRYGPVQQQQQYRAAAE